MKVDVLGLGQRGLGYITIIKYLHLDIEINSVCDLNHIRTDQVKKKFKISKQYYSDTELFNHEREADAIIIATQDRDHVPHAIEAINHGYKHILLEKPVSPIMEDIIKLEKLAKEKGVDIVVCHVLRYSKYYLTIKEIIKSGKIGKVITVNHMENVGFFHYAHSYVRGSWHNSNVTSPFLLAKCCHDFDLIHWFMNEKCVSVSAFGSLEYFTPENKPEGSAERCLDCEIKKCPFNAEYLYITAPLFKATFLKYQGRIITGKSGNTKKDLYEALRNTDYGKCVFSMDNNVCDHEIVNMKFEDGSTASHTVTAFSDKFYRRTMVSGTKGEIIGNDLDGVLHIRIFGGKKKNIHTKWLKGLGHLDGDIGLIRNWVNLLNGKLKDDSKVTYLSETLASHKIVLAAEESRMKNGETQIINI